MKTAKYSAYKPSEIEWLGDVPEHWRIDRLKASIVSCRNGIWGEEAQGDENDIPCVRVADFDRQKLRVELDEPTIRSVTGKERSGRLLSKGDLLLEKSGGGENQPVGCMVLYDDARPAVCSNFVARVVVANDQDSSYWRYVHAAAYAVRLTVGSINQTSGIQNLDQARYFNEYVAFPPPTEQAAIAAFLDRETAKIDALVEEQKRLIELLKEKRQAVISQAVTKGLNPNVPMKDSGVAWLGEVPAHWAVAPIKSFGWLKGGAGFPHEEQGIQGEELDFFKVAALGGGRSGVIDRAEHTISRSTAARLGAHVFPEGTVVFAKVGAALLLGRVRVLSASSCIDNNMMGIVPHEGTDSEFLRLAMSLVRFDLIANPGAVPSLNESQIGNFHLAKPSFEEQQSIATFVKAETAAIDSLTFEAQRGVDLLQERRSALISAAVTGKIDVRGLVPQPEVTSA
jgi:type I restriction enzyme S subunit